MVFKISLLLWILLIPHFLFSQKKEELIIHLKDPEYSQGVIKTEKGGVVTAPFLRIQAEKICYTDKDTLHSILAQGNLMMEYQGKVYVGERLEFDFIKKRGYLKQGRTKEGSWYLGGDWIELHPEGNFVIYGAYVTSSPSLEKPWEIQAKRANISKESILSAKDVKLKVMDIPILWIPSYSGNLKRFKDSPIRYRFQWDKDLNLRASMRYRFYSTETLAAYARFDYRFKKNLGPGGALEAEYESKDKQTVFQTKNYGALDKSFPDENGVVRYRFQGIYKTKTGDEKTRFHMQWDRLSDIRMVSDFKDPDFELNTQKTTYLELSHYRKWIFSESSVRPKINPFDTLAQELPYSVFGIHPFRIGKTGILMENYFSGSYLDYTFANALDKKLKNRKSGRLETINTIYRPFSWKGWSLAPRLGIVGIFYGNSPNQHSVEQFLYTYGTDICCRFSKVYSLWKHTIIPYASYSGFSKPSIPVDQYFVFDINDGYAKQNQIRFGVKHLFFTKTNSVFLPGLMLDLYAYSFWGARSFNRRIPKFSLDWEIQQQNYIFFGSSGWNFQERTLDYGNAGLLWTVSAPFALGLEIRHRSKFWWRKALSDDFTVDFARSLPDLLSSPLSDQRTTFLTKAHLRLSPRFKLHLQTFHGWGRKDEPNYHGAKLDFYTMLTGNWQMKLSYEYQPNDPYRFSYSFKIIQ